MRNPVLRLDCISKSFGALQVAKDVCLSVNPGEIHAVIGPNGAGKSTLVAQIAGTVRPDHGRIYFIGREVTDLTASTRATLGLARVFQTPSLVGSFTVLDNVALAAQAKAGSSFSFWSPASRDDGLNAKASAALEKVQLQARAQTRASLLSHGEKRGLELAMALVQEPVLLLLDEPMAGAGRQETRSITNLLASLKGQFAMLLIEHDMDAVFALADRISVLAAGVIIACDTPEIIKHDAVVRKVYLGERSA